MTMTQTPETPALEPPALDRPDLGSRPPRGRSLWVIFGSLLLISGLGWGVYTVVGALAHEEWTERYTVDAAELNAVMVDNDNGAVTMRGTAGDEVSAVAEVSRGLRNTEVSDSVADGVVEFTSSCPPFNDLWCSVQYTVDAPRDLDVVVNVDNGRVTVSDVAGSVTIDSDNGRVVLDAVSGAVQAHTDNGRIDGTDIASSFVDVETNNGRVELEFVAPPDQLIVTTDNGRIDVALPAVDGAYDIATATNNGSTDVGVATNPESTRQVRLQTHNGSITVRPAE